MSPTRESTQTTNASRATFLLLALSWLIAGLCLASVIRTRSIPFPDKSPISGVDPNVAPWWELTILPEIGPSLARRIVEHRNSKRAKYGLGEQGVVFRSARDLDAVEGIGPKTVARVAPHVRLEQDLLVPHSPGAANDQRQSQKQHD